MNVEEYFEIYTGGNDYIETWTPIALKDFAEAYHKMKKREENLVNNTVLDLVSGCYYSVKLMVDDEYEPALATYLHGGICFQFFNGVVVSSDKVNGYKKLNYR
tara:strand:+ start:614 stop:922 length:309 start_codon:yes stop_codon:yes gene_type:complete